MRRAVLLVGSPKPAGSTSGVIGGHLLSRLAACGFQETSVHVHAAIRTIGGTRELLAAIDHSDLVVLAAPLYVDSLPAAVVRAFEIVADHRRSGDVTTRPALVAIINSGFPEPFQCDTAVAICRLFARDARLEWAGGFRVGGGGALSGRSLSGARGPFARLAHALDLAAAALGDGRAIPAKAFELLDRPLVPVRLYTTMANLGMVWALRKGGNLAHFRDRPYDDAGVGRHI